LKRKKRPKWTPKYRLNPALSLLLVVLLTGLSTLLCLWVQPNSLRAVLAVLMRQPLLIVLNCLPIGLLILAFTCLFRNAFSGAGLIGTCWALLTMASRMKMAVRDEPVFPRDFALLKEVSSAVGHYNIPCPWRVIIVIVCFWALMKVCARIAGCKSIPILEHLVGRLITCLGCVAVLVVLTLTLFASNTLFNSFTVSNPYYIPTVFNELGFPYCFFHNFTTYTVNRPENFSKSEAASWETGNQTGLGKEVNVIMIQNEAFSDLTDQPVFCYSETEDPLQNLHALQHDKHCISGHVVVPGFAGGTANTEFDVLTGMQTNALSSTTTSAFRAVNRNLDSLYRIFSADGYQTEFIHPGYAWFYNRENVYRWLGADRILFAGDLPDPQYKGSWVTDDYLAGQIEDHFAQAASGGQLLFNFTVTIQNHMSYTTDKYGAGYAFPPVQTTAKLSDETRSLLSVYIEGVRDADAMLGRLTNYFSKRDEPVVLVFWGDHLPYLGDDQEAYRELGMHVSAEESDGDDPFLAFETPYVIWANDKAAEVLDWDSAVAALGLPKGDVLSACYLGDTVLELTGRSEESPWFSYLSQVRRELPVIQKKYCQQSDGVHVLQTDLTEKQRQMISRMRCWSYYKLKYKDVDG
jgi:hypothetical protein